MSSDRPPVARRHDAIAEALRCLRVANGHLLYVVRSLAEERGGGPETEAEVTWRGLAEWGAQLREAVERNREVVA